MKDWLLQAFRLAPIVRLSDVDGKLIKLAMADPAKLEIFAPIMTHAFTMGYLGNQFQVIAKR